MSLDRLSSSEYDMLTSFAGRDRSKHSWWTKPGRKERTKGRTAWTDVEEDYESYRGSCVLYSEGARSPLDRQKQGSAVGWLR
jgi:hypothetical protein